MQKKMSASGKYASVSVVLALGFGLLLPSGRADEQVEGQGGVQAEVPTEVQAPVEKTRTQETEARTSPRSAGALPNSEAIQTKKSRGNGKREKKTQGGQASNRFDEGTKAPNRFDSDIINKSKYELDGQPLEVDPD